MYSLILAAALAASLAAPQQDTAVSSDGGAQGRSQAAAPADTDTAPQAPLPVSLERIRGLLAMPVPLQETLRRRPTFRIEVEERRQVQDLLSLIEFDDSRTPVPAAGIYGYETQRVMLRSLSTPLMQPYAVFSGSELLTLAFEGVLKKYLGWRALNALSAADRARAENAARAEVASAVAAYCAGLPEAGAGVRLCTETPSR